MECTTSTLRDANSRADKTSAMTSAATYGEERSEASSDMPPRAICSGVSDGNVRWRKQIAAQSERETGKRESRS
jgi:hypothetical protein